MESKQNLPAGWRWVKLGEACNYSQYGLTVSELHSDDGYPLIRITDIDDLGNLKLEDIKCAQLDDTTFKRYELRDGDILFARTGSLGRTFLYSGNPSEAVFASYLIRFSLNKSIIEPLYLFYYTHSKEYFEFIEEKKHTVSQPNINAEEYKSLLIPLPPLSEQKRIAAKLKEMMNEIDNARLACEKQLEAAKALPYAYLREVFESPEAHNWPKKKLGEIIKSTQSGTWGEEPDNSSACHPVIRVSDIDSNYKIKYDSLPLRKISERESKNLYLEENDLLVVKSSGSHQKVISGKVAIFDKERETKVFYSNFIFRLRVDLVKASSLFLWYYLNSSYAYSYVRTLVGASTYPNLKPRDYLGIVVPLPPLSEQKRIAEYLKEKITQAEKLKAAIEKELSTINSLPQSILSKAFKGEI